MKFWPKPLWLKVFFSNRYVYAQVVRKEDAHILASASTIEPSLRSALASTSSSDRAACSVVGKLLAERCKAQEIPELHFVYKPGQSYHGKLKTLLDTIVKNGVQIRH